MTDLVCSHCGNRDTFAKTTSLDRPSFLKCNRCGSTTAKFLVVETPRRTGP